MSIALPGINRLLYPQQVRARLQQSMLTTKTVNSYTADDANAATNLQFNDDNTHNQALSADPTIADNEMEQLNAANDNYVENIATMKIADDSNVVLHQQLTNNNKLNFHNSNNNNNDNNINNDDDEFSSSIDSNDDWADAMSNADGPLDNLADDYSLARLFLNDVQISRSEEEQTISELVDATGQGGLVEAHQHTSMRVAFGIILRLVLPLANGVVRGFKGIRDVRFLRVLRSIASSRQALTNLVAFAANTISLNLSSVQVSHRIEPILKLMKIRKARDGVESLPDVPSIDGASSPSTPTTTVYSPIIREPKGSLPQFSTSKRKSSVPQPPAPKCCTLNVVAEPPPGQPIRADIVFIHGLHGSLVNTWKQGLWENDRQPVGFQRPPKPPVRPPKRPRHSRALHHMHPPHKQKRARFAHGDHRASHERSMGDDLDDCNDAQGSSFSYVCGEPQDTQICDGFEYSFPTFRVRANDNGRLLQAELESILNDENASQSNEQKKCENGAKGKGKNAPKPSPDDPDYSKCWPGDWLPLDCPGVRVIAVNYTTDQYLWRPLWKKKEPRSNLIERSREMAELLIQHRVGYGHPVVWVGHSKGGLFVKQIIVDAWESGRPAMAPFWRSARGVFFYSVPHRGAHLASIKAPLLTRSVELIDIEKNSKYLLDLHRRFVGLYHLGHLKIEVFSFVETALTLMSVLYLRIVGVDSADPGIGDVCGIRLDHREICKPRSRDCILYKELVKMINKVC